jgi:hypothetical protein
MNPYESPKSPLQKDNCTCRFDVFLVRAIALVHVVFVPSAAIVSVVRAFATSRVSASRAGGQKPAP